LDDTRIRDICCGRDGIDKVVVLPFLSRGSREVWQWMELEGAGEFNQREVRSTNKLDVDVGLVKYMPATKRL